MIRHIIFDMDGTLSDTGKATLKAIDIVKARFQLPPVTYADVQNAMGLAGLEFHRALFPGISDDVLANVEPAVDALELEAVQNMGAEILFPGVSDMLAALWQAGYGLHIASTGSKTHVSGTLEATRIEPFFTSISCDEPAKISMVQRIIAGSNSKEWAMVGDMYKDSEAARGNNILALGAGYGYLAEADYPLFDAVLDTPMDIWAYL